MGTPAWGKVSLGMAHLTATLVMAGMIMGAAQAQTKESPTNTPNGTAFQPHYASLKADKVNVRGGPSLDDRIVWIFRRAGLPVEVLAQSGHWRRVRDSEGAEGWVFFRLLSARRTALVIPWEKGKPVQQPLLPEKDKTARPLAYLEPGVLANIHVCDGKWCRVSVGEFTGWLPQETLWGVYPGEKIP